MTKNLALIGFGYWGPNLLRNFINIPNCNIRYCCDIDLEKLQEIKRKFPHMLTTQNYNEILDDESIDAVILATPTSTHFDLAVAALNGGKDVLVEKPMVQTLQQAKILVQLAKKRGRILMVDHTFLFNPAVIKIKELIDKGEIGKILYIDSTRTNLGLFQKDINVIFDLAAHDFSIIQYILGTQPKQVSTIGKSHFNNQVEVAYITASYPEDIFAHIHVSWISPVKVRRMLITGTKKMIVYDEDTAPAEKIRVYDKGVTLDHPARSIEQIKIGYRTGDVWLPKIDIVEPLSLMAKSFVVSITSRKVLRSDGRFGSEIIKILETASNSLKKGTKVKDANSFS
ncbi:MAG: Gfo/Idh/MocA family oxidoreductase [Patescibacteria group bacterium]